MSKKDSELPFTVRRAGKADIEAICRLISKEPRANRWILAKKIFNNIGIIILMFISCVFAMITPVLLRKHDIAFFIYLLLGLAGALLAYACALLQGFFLFGKRYTEMFAIIQCFKEQAHNSDSREEIEKFIKKYQFFVAVPNNQDSTPSTTSSSDAAATNTPAILGVISVAAFKDHCETSEAIGNGGESGYMAMKRALPKGTQIISEKTAVMPWIVVNMGYCRNIQISNYFTTRLKSKGNKVVHVKRPLYEVIYDKLLKHVQEHVIDVSNDGGNKIGFMIAECDDFQVWQQDIIYQCNGYAFVGERIDTTWEPFGPFPNKKYFFMRVCDRDMAKNLFGDVVVEEGDKKQNSDSEIESDPDVESSAGFDEE